MCELRDFLSFLLTNVAVFLIDDLSECLRLDRWGSRSELCCFGRILQLFRLLTRLLNELFFRGMLTTKGAPNSQFGCAGEIFILCRAVRQRINSIDLYNRKKTRISLNILFCDLKLLTP